VYQIIRFVWSVNFAGIPVRKQAGRKTGLKNIIAAYAENTSSRSKYMLHAMKI
jgi:hypothetical protein